MQIEDGFALSTLALFEYETDKEAMVQASIGYHARLKASNNNSSEALEKLTELIRVVGHDFHERRFTAFCGLTVLDRLDIMLNANERLINETRKVSLDITWGYDLNIPFIRFLIKNWEKVKSCFQEEFWERVFSNKPDIYHWNKLAQWSDENIISKQELLDFLHLQKPKRAEAQSLYFLNRVQPKSNLLLEYCLGTLMLTDESEPQNYHQSYSNISHWDQIAAAEILADNFGGDTNIYKRIITSRIANYHADELILVLSEGWPESDELNLLLSNLLLNPAVYWESTIIRYYCLKVSKSKMYMELLKRIHQWSLNPQLRIHEAIIKPLTRRFKKDKRLAAILYRRLNHSKEPSEKISISKLLYLSIGLTSDMKSWAENEIEKQLSGIGVEIGYDFTTGSYKSVPSILYEILNSDENI
jgi:hypothetical protein